MFEGSSPFSDYVDTTFLLISGVSLLVLVGLLVAMVAFVIRYSRKRNPHPTNIEGNIPLEITWTVIPLILFMGMFYLGWKGYLMQAAIPENALPLKVTGQMWKWTFEYPNGVTTDTLRVPVNAPVKLDLRSIDVNHSFYIPAFRIKKDVIPNRGNQMWFTVNKVAAYDIACAEYCGLNHAYMYTKVIAKDTAAFEAWYADMSAKQSKSYTPLTAATNTK
ncbi:MAG: cytochrome c oxidase subunit II [Bacteroidetes bacterium]|jgi:cytochrome c oxidase subunit 2|nr:cytochrome c oxidase subunit II [Bacteroidota bacterium]